MRKIVLLSLFLSCMSNSSPSGMNSISLNHADESNKFNSIYPQAYISEQDCGFVVGFFSFTKPSLEKALMKVLAQLETDSLYAYQMTAYYKIKHYILPWEIIGWHGDCIMVEVHYAN